MAIAVIAAVLVGCGKSSSSTDTPTLGITGKALGLVVSPEGVVFVETERGVWRVPSSSDDTASLLRAVLQNRAGEIPIGRLLTIAFASRSVMLGSSHPDRSFRGVESELGLMTSRDGGTTWRLSSLYGKADLHLMRATRRGLWALDISALRLAVTQNEGRSWAFRDPPGIVTDLAVDPRDPNHGVAVTENGLLETRDAARTWRPAAFGEADAVAWAANGVLYGVASDGSVRSAESDRSAAQVVGRLGGSVERLASGPGRSLWALDRRGLLSRSGDGGRTWVPRAKLR